MVGGLRGRGRSRTGADAARGPAGRLQRRPELFLGLARVRFFIIICAPRDGDPGAGAQVSAGLRVRARPNAPAGHGRSSSGAGERRGPRELRRDRA